MCILFVNDQQRANHYGEYAVQFDKALLDDGSFDPKIAKGLNHIVFTRREVTELQEELQQLHHLHILTNTGSRRPAQTLRDYLAE